MIANAIIVRPVPIASTYRVICGVAPARASVVVTALEFQEASLVSAVGLAVLCGLLLDALHLLLFFGIVGVLSDIGRGWLRIDFSGHRFLLAKHQPAACNERSYGL